MESERKALVRLFYADGGGDPEERIRHAIAFAQDALKALFLANGGAVVALFSLLSSERVEVERGALVRAVTLFAVGLAASLCSSIGAHLSQNFFFLQAVKARRADVADLPTRYRCDWARLGDLCQDGATVLALLSVALFVGGAVTAAEAF